MGSPLFPVIVNIYMKLLTLLLASHPCGYTMWITPLSFGHMDLTNSRYFTAVKVASESPSNSQSKRSRIIIYNSCTDLFATNKKIPWLPPFIKRRCTQINTYTMSPTNIWGSTVKSSRVKGQELRDCARETMSSKRISTLATCLYGYPKEMTRNFFNKLNTKACSESCRGRIHT